MAKPHCLGKIDGSSRYKHDNTFTPTYRNKKELYDRISPHLIRLINELFDAGKLNPDHVLAAMKEADDQFVNGYLPMHGMRPAEQLKNPIFDGLYHKHYFTTQSVRANMERTANYLTKGKQRPLSEDEARKVVKTAINAAPKRYSCGEATGDWLIFRRTNGANHYLTLWEHDRSRDQKGLSNRLNEYGLLAPLL